MAVKYAELYYFLDDKLYGVVILARDDESWTSIIQNFFQNFGKWPPWRISTKGQFNWTSENVKIEANYNRRKIIIYSLKQIKEIKEWFAKNIPLVEITIPQALMRIRVEF